MLTQSPGSMHLVRFSSYFGFTEGETNRPFDIYRKTTKNPKITREDLRIWYDGYHTASGERLYNLRSVVCALSNNQLANYWTGSGPYDEIYSAKVVYGLLTYEDGKVFIPNKELMDQFQEFLMNKESMGYVYRLANEGADLSWLLVKPMIRQRT